MLAFLLTLTAASAAGAPIVHRPANLARTRKVPLVLVLHGARGSPAQIARRTGFDALADREGFVVAYPKSAGVAWSADDLGALRDAIDALVAAQNIDRSRVYVAGFSSGAFMAYRLACALPDRIAAIADVGGGVSRGELASCAPLRPVSVLAIHGDADATVPVAGNSKVAPLERTLAVFQKVDGCAAAPESDDANVAATTRWTCGAGAVTRVIVHGGGHAWPTPEAEGKGVDATTAAWRFFAAHPRKD